MRDTFIWRYGLHGQEFSVGTVVEWDKDNGFGFCSTKSFKDWFAIREQEVLVQCNPYRVCTDSIEKNIKVGDVIETVLIEVHQGLLGLAIRETGTSVEPVDSDYKKDSWSKGVDSIPRFTGNVQAYFRDRTYGFIKSDQITESIYFQKREVMIPYEQLQNSMDATDLRFGKRQVVTFDAVQTPRGMRALAIKKWDE